MTLTAAWFGDRAVLVTLERGDRREAVRELLAASLPGASVRTGLQSVLVEAEVPDPGLLTSVAAVLDGVDLVGAARASESRTVDIPVTYGGPDLADVARALAVPTAAVVSAHQQQRWVVAMMGFAPGFGYLLPFGGAVLEWGALPRRDRPRERVPAGSVAVAAGMSAVYPTAMPGGWSLIGTTGLPLFDERNEAHPTALRPGDLVRFVDAST